MNITIVLYCHNIKNELPGKVSTCNCLILGPSLAELISKFSRHINTIIRFYPKHRRMYRLVLIVQYASHCAPFIPPDVISQSGGFVDGQALRVDGGEPGCYGVRGIKSPLAPFSKGGIEECSPIIRM